MINGKRNSRFLARLQAAPLDLRPFEAPEAARRLFGFLQQHFRPGDECSIWTPAEARSRGYSAFWRVSWESGPLEWGALLTLGESLWLRELGLPCDHRPEVLVVCGQGWYTEPHYAFDVGFIEET